MISRGPIGSNKNAEERDIPGPPQIPAVKASTSFPFFSSNSGLIFESATFRMHRSFTAGLLFGLYFQRVGELRIRSLVGKGRNWQLRVQIANAAAMAAPPTTAVLSALLMRPILLWFWSNLIVAADKIHES